MIVMMVVVILIMKDGDVDDNVYCTIFVDDNDSYLAALAVKGRMPDRTVTIKNLDRMLLSYDLLKD